MNKSPVLFRCYHICLAVCLFIHAATIQAQQPLASASSGQTILPGAARFDQYLSLITGKSIAIFANQTSVIDASHLVDALLLKGINIKKIFSPEHGFRGTADAGEKVGNTVDSKTNIPLISLYGPKRKPSAEDLKDVDVMIFDIQDVGVRFYTYISSLQEYMESAIQNNKTLIILDRPNPNGFYVDGPVLDRKFTSYVGMQPVPVVYGMTIGEYARMLLGERWIDSSLVLKLSSKEPSFKIIVIPCSNYTHKSLYVMPVRPSPNLPEIQSTYWYPSTCFFEGTVLSEGRGTDKPFQLFGHPSLPKSLVGFTPKSKEGATDPKLKDQLCYGWDLSGTREQVVKQVDKKIQLKYVLEAYRLFPDKNKFFLATNYFNKLAGNDILMQQIKNGVGEKDIRKSWQPELEAFKKIRKKYLLYADFE